MTAGLLSKMFMVNIWLTVSSETTFPKSSGDQYDQSTFSYPMCHHRRTRLWGSSGNGFRPQAALADLKDLHPSLPLPTRKL